MNRVYSLLRNNKQSGPHSLDDLRVLSLKPFDLIWIEGKSAGWSYPTDIEELKAYVTDSSHAIQQTDFITKTNFISEENKDLAKNISGKIHVSLPRVASEQQKTVRDAAPVYNFEQKAEELKKRVQEYRTNSFPRESKPQIKYNRSLEAVEEDYTNWVYEHKTKKKRSAFKPIAITGLCLILVAGCYFLIQSFSDTPPSVQQTADQPILSTNDSLTTKAFEPGDDRSQELSTSEILTQQPLVKGKNSVAKAEQTTESIAIDKPVEDHPSQEIINAETEPGQRNETIADSTTNNEKATQEPQESEPKEKRKTLAEKIDGFFEKLGAKKQKEIESQDRPQTPTDSSERKSKRRDDETKTQPQGMDLASLVDITANHPDNWMMGIKGLKLTLRNRSNETIKTATVEVSYYNEQNSLLEKKLVYFTNIAPKKSLTVPAPDHRLADHADFRLLSVSSAEDSYVKQ